MSDNRKFRFITKPKASGGKESIALAVVSVVIMAAAVLVSAFMGGEGSVILGALGLCAIGFAIYGFILGLKGLNEKKVDHKLSFIGTLGSGLAGILWLAIFFLGIK